MERLRAEFVWESFPEHQAMQQYSRCLGRIGASLPAPLRQQAMRPLIRGALLIGRGIAGAHAVGPAALLDRRERELFRDGGLEAVATSREGLRLLQQVHDPDAASLTAALELLERVESGLRERPLPD